ncbi:aminopeptidase [Desulfitobacterium sp. THU1]|uniref:aminopeptidase n=1 Tax=Desulfitobacterium sp. THU1 TaxID=3138072 RepID=UPI00311F13AD
MNDQLLEKYAQLIVKSGVNLQPNQILVINSPLECAEFTRKIAGIAYQVGAKDVAIFWKDELMSKIRFLQAPDAIFDEFPEWQKAFYLDYSRQGAAFLSISASDPELMKEVNPDRIVRAQRASSTALKEYRDRLMSNHNPWCVVSVPTQAWAKKVFPNVSINEAMDKLWDAIFKSVRADQEDPVKAWQIHKENLNRSMNILNTHRFRTLHFENSLGTDLWIELPEGHLWVAGADITPEGIEFIANMPTEEVFTLPKRAGVNGKVFSSLPLNYNGSLIKNFSLTFKDGRIIDFSAEEGLESLAALINTDEGSHYLGEVALVPDNSPISNSKILFYNTLFDENAACHLAIGKAYPVCLENGDKLSESELTTAGVNESMVHEDFMIGTPDLKITGITSSGDEVPVFSQGNFAF